MNRNVVKNICNKAYEKLGLCMFAKLTAYQGSWGN